ncbi:D-arabinono-1,4-lactone oxidase [Acinetobacter silvestris]|uniref:FAD-linked oxidoreductase n=1 Tax=Acinetobacter silvestris TaxID=1977882 RepID=A0A1Y3CN52_9GAMM|nr:D-arabinono-1,4-lactone oxidase [Acinetobacter silvestris]OTG67313.1 FAD-linked oxidoreductase [Acinetobacter silvestris]
MSEAHQVTWSNWSGYQQAHPQLILKPQSLTELEVVVASHTKIRVVGAGHSFSPLVCTDATLVSLDHLVGVDVIDEERCIGEIWAGTRLYHLDQYLQPFNQTLMQQGDIDQQSLAGAVSTGTHGTGEGLYCISGYVEDFELLTASGELLQCSRTEHPEIFAAGRVALGSLGILTKIRMQNRPHYKLKECIQLCPLADMLQNIQQWKIEHRHIECFIFPYSDQVMLKTLDDTAEDLQPRKASWPSEDSLLTLCSELTKTFPTLNPYLQKMLSIFVKPTTYVDWSSQIFPTPRTTKFNEMEYQIPVAQGLTCLQEVLAALRKNKVSTFFPLEFRFVKGDDIWLSPFYQQDSISISVHQYHKQDPYLIFNVVEPIFQKYQGRPHWGKMHSMTTAQLRKCYPKWDDFMRLREQLDPERKFLNPYLEQLFLSKK